MLSNYIVIIIHCVCVCLYSMPQQQFCGAAVPHDDDNHHDDQYNHYPNNFSPFVKSKAKSGHTPGREAGGSRLKRQTDTVEASTVCPVNLVATTSFYERFGASNEDHTVNFLVSYD